MKKIRMNELRKFVKKYNKLPKPSVKEEKSLYYWMNSNKNNSEIKKIIEKYGEEKIDYFQRFIDFTKKYHRLPIWNIKGEKTLYNWIERNKNIFKVKEIIEIYRINNNLQRFINFVEEHKRLPKSYIKEEINLYQWMYYNKDNPEVKKIIKKYKYRKNFDYTQKIIDFIEEYHRLPRYSIKEENGLYQSMRKKIKKKEKYPELYLYYTLFTHQDEPGVKNMIDYMISQETLSD